MIQNYIFDLYGTLVDIRTDEERPSFWKHLALLFALQGAEYAPGELKTAYRSAVEAQIDRRAQELTAIPREYIEPDILPAFESLYALKGVAASTETVRAMALSFRMLSMGYIRAYPGALRVLDTLRARGKGVYLLSNAQAAFTVPELNMLGLMSRFHGVVLSSDVGIQKPDRALFEHMLSQYHLSPETCVMVGNDACADMGGAAAVGIAGRYIHTGISPDRQDPLPEGCIEIRRLKELL